VFVSFLPTVFAILSYMKKIAILDIDGTLSNSHLGVEFLKEMSALGAIKGVNQALFTKQYEAWAQSSEKTDYYDRYFDQYYDTRLVGVDKRVFEEAGRRIANHAYPHFYTETLTELKRHQAEGRFIILISKSPEQAVAKIAELVEAGTHWGWQFNFDHAGKYVGQYTYPDGESDKAYIIKQLVQKHDLDLNDSYAYGDSAGDISMLHLVSNPVAVNPEPKLLMEAQQNNWRILRAKPLKNS